MSLRDGSERGRQMLIRGLPCCLFALLAVGCASRMTLGGLASAPELTSVPFFAQTEYDCGPAALATILNAAQAEVSPAQLIDMVYIEGLQGSLQAELLAATRRLGRVPMTIEPRVEALLAEIRSGRPVLVLQNLGLAHAPVWHYAVVVGFDADARRFVLRSGEEPRRRERVGRFMREWELAENWAFVVAPLEEIPASATPDRYMRALVGSQQQLGSEASGVAFDAALSRWPEEPLVLFLAAARKHEDADLSGAAALYRKLLDIEPKHAAAHNNLANVLLEQGCRDEALREAKLADAQQPSDGTFSAAIADTLRRIESLPDQAPGAVSCASPAQSS